MTQDKEAIEKMRKEIAIINGGSDTMTSTWAKAIYNAGYRKPSGQPKLVRNNPYENIPFREGQPVWVVGVQELHKAYEDGKKIQWEADIKFYEGG